MWEEKGLEMFENGFLDDGETVEDAIEELKELEEEIK